MFYQKNQLIFKWILKLYKIIYQSILYKDKNLTSQINFISKVTTSQLGYNIDKVIEKQNSINLTLIWMYNILRWTYEVKNYTHLIL